MLKFPISNQHPGGFPGDSPAGKEPTCQCRRRKFDPWVRKSPWRRKWQSTPVFLPGKSPWTAEPGGLQSLGSQRVRHDFATGHARTQPAPQLMQSAWVSLLGTGALQRKAPGGPEGAIGRSYHTTGSSGTQGPITQRAR